MKAQYFVLYMILFVLTLSCHCCIWGVPLCIPYFTRRMHVCVEISRGNMMITTFMGHAYFGDSCSYSYAYDTMHASVEDHHQQTPR